MNDETYQLLLSAKDRLDLVSISKWSQEDIALMTSFYNMISIKPYPTILTCQDCAVMQIKSKINIYINNEQRRKKESA